MNDFDFDLGEKGDGINSGADGLGMEIEMTPQTPIVSVARAEGEVVGDSEEEEETRHQGVLTETSTFGGPKSSRASEESLRSTSSKSSYNTATNTQEPTQQQYIAYKPGVSSASRNITASRSPLTPIRRAATTNVDNPSEPIDYFNSASAPRRAGTAPPTASMSAQQRSPPINYFGTESTPARVQTAPPRSQGSQGRNLAGSPREQGEGGRREQSLRVSVRRTETAPVEFSPRDQREQRGPRHPRGYGDEGGDMV